MRSQGMTWLRELVKLPNLLILAMFLYSLGGWVRANETDRDALQQQLAQEQRQIAALEQTMESTYVRKDVLGATLGSINDHLKNIDATLQVLEKK